MIAYGRRHGEDTGRVGDEGWERGLAFFDRRERVRFIEGATAGTHLRRRRLRGVVHCVWRDCHISWASGNINSRRDLG